MGEVPDKGRLQSACDVAVIEAFAWGVGKRT